MRGLRGALAIASIFAMSVVAVPAAGAVNYAATGSFSSTGAFGVAVDQASENVYVTQNETSGLIHKFDSSSQPLGSLGPAGEALSGVAVDPTDPDLDGDHNIYAFVRRPAEGHGIVTFDSGSGVCLNSCTPIEVPIEEGEQSNHYLAADSSGNIYFANSIAGTVEEYSPSGELLQSITCSACSAPFVNPSAIAIDPDGNIYVGDTGTGVLVKLGPEGDSDPAEPVVVQSAAIDGVAALGLAIDQITGDVFVSNVSLTTFEISIAVFDASGAKLTSFGEGTLGGFTFYFPLAVNSASGVVYASRPDTETVFTFAPASPPTSLTGSASSIGSTSVTLAGTVNPNGFDVFSCSFRYSTDLSYDHSAPCTPAFVGEGTEPVSVTAKVSGLTPNQGYHFKLVAENAGGPGEGADATFTTLAGPPTVVTGGSSGVTQTAATVSGTVNPNSGNVSNCHVDYGTSASYGSQAPCVPGPGGGAGPVSISASLSSLAAGTLYHYRVVATNAGGTTNGKDATFTTENAPPPNNGGSGAPPPIGVVVPPPVNKTIKCKKGFKKVMVKGKAKCKKVKKKHKKR